MRDMKEALRIPIDQDSVFRQAVERAGLTIICIEEHIEYNRYEVTMEHAFELFYLGQYVGIELNYRYHTKYTE